MHNWRGRGLKRPACRCAPTHHCFSHPPARSPHPPTHPPTHRSSRSFRPPFRVYPLVEEDIHSGDKLTLYLRLLAEYPPTKTATGVEVVVPLPRSVLRVHCETGGCRRAGRAEGTATGPLLVRAGLPHPYRPCCPSHIPRPPDSPTETKLLGLPSKGGFEQGAEWHERERRLVWSLHNLKGGREHTLRARLTVEPGSLEATKRDYGPVMLQFVLPGKPSGAPLRREGRAPGGGGGQGAGPLGAARLPRSPPAPIHLPASASHLSAASGLDVKYMKILREEKGYSPSRWFRVVCLANSYQIRPS